MPICTTCVCIDARASRRVRMPGCAHAHAHRRLHLRLAASIPSRMRVWMDLYACVYRWLGIDGRASVCMYMCIYRTVSISLLYIYYVLICMHYVMYGPIAAVCTQVSMSVCTQTDRYRWGARVSRAIGSAKYTMCMDIRLYLDTCTSERRRDARVRVRLRRMRARVRPCRVVSASGHSRRSERIGVPITRMRVRV
jgi:hypothetical protein